MQDKIGVHIPREKVREKPIERLIELGRVRDRSVNYLVVQAILEYLEREENQK